MGKLPFNEYTLWWSELKLLEEDKDYFDDSKLIVEHYHRRNKASFFNNFYTKLENKKEIFKVLKIDIPSFLFKERFNFKFAKNYITSSLFRKLVRSGKSNKIIIYLSKALFSLHMFFTQYKVNIIVDILKHERTLEEMGYDDDYDPQKPMLLDIIKKLLDFNPMFFFLVFKNDKNIRRYSRNKVPKYSIKYVYLTRSKRFYKTVSWFYMFIKFIKTRKFYNKINISIFRLLSNSKYNNLEFFKKKSYSNFYLKNKNK